MEIKRGVKQVKRWGMQVCEANPFLSGVVIRTKKRNLTIARGLSVIDKDGEVVGEGVIGQVKPVDDEQFVKVFAQNIRQIFDLNLSGMRMLMVLMHAVQDAPGADQVYCGWNFAQDVYTKKLDERGTFVRSTYDRGVANLVENKILAPSNRGVGWFFINPTVIFNGDRAKFQQVIMKRSKYDELMRERRFNDAAELYMRQASLPFGAPGPADKGEDE